MRHGLLPEVEGGVVDPARLVDLSEIERLKSRYFRYVDTKQWSALRGLFTDDLVMFADDSPLPETTEPVFVGADEFIAYMTTAHASSITVHQGHMADIEFVDEHRATGIWAMFDWVDHPATGTAKQGFGHYHEQYEKGVDGQWRIKVLRLTRLRVDAVDSHPPVANSTLLTLPTSRRRGGST